MAVVGAGIAVLLMYVSLHAMCRVCQVHSGPGTEWDAASCKYLTEGQACQGTMGAAVRSEGLFGLNDGDSAEVATFHGF